MLLFVFALVAAAKGPIDIAVLPPVAIDGKEAWLGLAVADNLGSGLLRFGQADAKSKRPLSVFSWRETWSAARSEGLDVHKPLGADSVKRLATQLGARLVFTGSYKVKPGKNPRVLMKWRIVDVTSKKKPKEMRVETDLSTLSTKADKLVQSVVKSVGLKPIKGKPAAPVPVAAQRAYAQGLEVLSRQSLDPQARIVLSTADLKKARDFFALAAKTAPKFSRARVGVVMATTMLGEQNDVTDLIVGLRETEPLDAMCLSYVLSRQGKLDAAAKVMSEVTTTHPGFLAGLGKLGNIYLQSGQFEQAAAVFASYSVRVPKNPWARLMHAKALSRMGSHDEAIAESEEVVSTFPTSLSAQLGLALRLSDVKKFADAQTHLEKALVAFPEHPVVMARLSYVKLKLGQTDAALALAKKAVERLGDARGHTVVGYAYANLGHALALKGKKDEAVVAFNKAAELGVSVEDREALLADPGTKKLLEDSNNPLAEQPASQPVVPPVATPETPAAEEPEKWTENAKFKEDEDWDEEDFDDQPEEGSAPASKPVPESVAVEN